MPELTKHTFNLRKGDMEHLQTLAPKGKASELLRKIISRFVDSTREAPTTPAPEADIDNLNL